MKTKKILFAGGPATGKTAVLNNLKQQGYCCYEEVSRQVTLAAQKQGIPQLFLKDPLLFSEKLREGRINQFKKAQQSNEPVCFMDRGIPEVSAYMDYKNENVPSYFRTANRDYQYDKVFIFPLWADIYSSDNERYETFTEAREIHDFITKTYKDLGYYLTEVPKTSIEDRAQFILKASL